MHTWGLSDRLRLQSLRRHQHIAKIDTTELAKGKSGEREKGKRYTLGKCLHSGKSEVNKKEKKKPNLEESKKVKEPENTVLEKPRKFQEYRSNKQTKILNMNKNLQKITQFDSFITSDLRERNFNRIKR